MATNSHGILTAEPNCYANGNATMDGDRYRGWFVGSFIPDAMGMTSSNDVEIKWGVHEPGEGQEEWTINRTATTISILVRGRDRIAFPDGDILLEKEGDYAIWGPGVPHKWQAIDHCVVISVRWPSDPGDSFLASESDLADFMKRPTGASKQQQV